MTDPIRNELAAALRNLENAASDTLREHADATECCDVTRWRCEQAREILAKHDAATPSSDSVRDSAGAGEGWRPIETAPKDGSFVYVTDQVHPDVARIASWRVPITHRKGEAWCTKKGYAIGNLPSQWMPLREPLPAAPSQPRWESK